MKINILLIKTFSLLILAVNGLNRHENQLCEKGLSQTPIDFNTAPVKVAGRSFKILYESVKGMLKWDKVFKAFSIIVPPNDRHNLKVEFSPMKKKKISDKKFNYLLESVIIRIPGEHLFNSNRPQVEIQFNHVIEKPNEKYYYNRLSFSIFANVSEKPDALLENILPDSEVEFKNISKEIDSLPYLQYLGSLTLNPCSQDVNWIAFGKKFMFNQLIYKSMLQATKDKIKVDHNNRAVQLLRSRRIFQFGELDINALFKK
jgi:carbonic anhydrase